MVWYQLVLLLSFGVGSTKFAVLLREAQPASLFSSPQIENSSSFRITVEKS